MTKAQAFTKAKEIKANDPSKRVFVAKRNFVQTVLNSDKRIAASSYTVVVK